ncbi:Uncharacterized protein FKW44_011940, partial [Caligus rogercresseyi]
MRWVYTSIIRPKISYGSIVWSRRTQNYLKKLERIQRLGMIRTTFIYRSTPTKGLEVIFDLPPLDLYIKMRARKALFNLNITPHGWESIGSKPGHILEEWRENKKLGISSCINRDFSTSLKMSWKKTFSINYDSFSVCEVLNASNGIQCYTDGSKIANKIILYNPLFFIINSAGKLNDECTVFQAEVWAILKAALLLLKKKISNQKIDFYVENQAALVSLGSVVVKSRTVNNCINVLNALGRVNHANLHWIKAHVGWPGNEKADRLAKAGSRSNLLKDIPIPDSFMSDLTRRGLYREWASRWTQDSSCRQSKLWLPKPDPNASKRLINLSRESLCIQIQIITGHNFLRYHQSFSNKFLTRECRFCQQSDETSYHVLAECDFFCLKRMIAQKCFNQHPPELKQIPAILRNCNIGYLFGFP